ncbi:MAG: class I adenylate-forming enzyme family protein [Parasphingorhabdus sp.]
MTTHLRNPIAKAVARIAREDPRREVIVDGSLRLSYGDLAQSIDKSSSALIQAGLRPGARVAFMGFPGAIFLTSELSTQMAGGVWLGLNAKYTVPELAYVLADAMPDLVFVEDRVGDICIANVLAAAGRLDPQPRIQVVDSVADLADIADLHHTTEDLLGQDDALIVYTSGTTGSPKGARLTHAGISEATRLYRERYQHPKLRSLLNLPINHVGSLIDLAASGIGMGGTLIAMPGFEPEVIPDLMREERISLLGQVPAMHLAIEAAAPYDPGDYPSLAHLVWSGAAMPRSWIERHYNRGAELSTCYGQTECTGSITFTTKDATIDELADTIGRSADEKVTRLVAEDGKVIEGEGRGEIQLRGPLLMSGYHNRAEATKEAFADKVWLRTGDLATRDENSNYAIVGRLKEMFKSGGFNVYPREVEITLEEHPGVTAAAVISRPDERWQEVGWAFLMKRADITDSELKTFASDRLANYKVPKRFIVQDELPLLPIGKIDKKALAAMADRGEFG